MSRKDSRPYRRIRSVMDANEHLTGHFVVCGLGHVGYRIVELLKQFNETYVVVTRDIRAEWRANVEAGAAGFILADARLPASLAAARIDTARAVFVVTDDDLTNIEICLDVQRLNPAAPLIVRIFDRFIAQRAKREMRLRGVLSPGLLSAPIFVAAARGDEMIRTFRFKGEQMSVVRLELNGPVDGGASLASFCDRRGLVPLVLDRTSPSDRLAAAADALLQAGDRLVVAADGAGIDRLCREKLLARLQPQAEGGRLLQRLVGALRRPGALMQTVRHRWNRVSGVMRFSFLALMVVLITSIVVFHRYLPGNPSWIDAIYFTVTTMSTVGFGDYSLKDASPWLKVYGCVVMIANAGLVAVAFSLLTDHIVSTRVQQALGRRTTSLSGHSIVVGLGDVGTRVAEELHRAGEGVVAIERDAEHEAVPALQDRMQVIIGDANRESTMRQANFAQARAVIVTTTDDLASLRIAHQAEAANSNVRTVVRIYDSELAGKLSKGLGINRTINAAQAAAATFVACALGERVEQSFMLGRRLLAYRRVPGKAVGAARDPAALGEDGLVLEEYDPTTRTWGAPVCAFADAAQ